MRFHVISLPHTETTADYSACAYTMKVLNFCRMMRARGHDVMLYAGANNEAPCSELIPCSNRESRKAAGGGGHYSSASFDYTAPHWTEFNTRAIAAIKKRAQPGDFLCLIAGWAHKQIADALPGMTAVEFGIGYGGVFAPFRVFESYAWMHTVYGSQHGGTPHAIDGAWSDAVIPGYLDPAAFPFGEAPDDYFLFVGRMIERKGLHIAVDLCKRIGARLVVAGPGTPPDGVEYAGVVGPEERGRLMAGARALLAPTIYVEPFGNVAIEAMTCGAPVICTDWGAFTETVQQDVTGFRCRTMGEFIAAATNVENLDRAAIRDYAIIRYSLDVVGKMYEDYFKRIDGVRKYGWYGQETTSSTASAGIQ